jgi:hypothetical protein
MCRWCGDRVEVNLCPLLDHDEPAGSSLLAALDVHPRVAMQILRHSRVAITMEIYTEIPSAVTREALRKLGQWLEDTQT